MPEYEFEFVISGIDPSDNDAAEQLLLAMDHEDYEFDVYVTAGIVRLEFVWAGEGQPQVLHAALDRLTSVAPHVKVLRLHRRLVGIPEIASHLEKTEEAIRLIALHKRRHNEADRFPAPVEIMNGGSKIWDWSDVCLWFKRNGDLVGEPNPIEGEEAVMFNAHLLAGCRPKTSLHSSRIVEFDAFNVFSFSTGDLFSSFLTRDHFIGLSTSPYELILSKIDLQVEQRSGSTLSGELRQPRLPASAWR